MASENRNHTRDEELRAQRIACGYLVRAGEQAVAELELDLTAVEQEDERALMERAGVVLAELIADWRETLLILRAATGEAPPRLAHILRGANSR